jgi:hypothetical protein
LVGFIGDARNAAQQFFGGEKAAYCFLGLKLKTSFQVVEQGFICAFASSLEPAPRPVAPSGGTRDFMILNLGRFSGLSRNSFHAGGAGTGSAPALDAVFRARAGNRRARMACQAESIQWAFNAKAQRGKDASQRQ